MADSASESGAGVAAVLSLVVPGVGQIYNGDMLRGIVWLVITPGFWIGSGGCLGWVCHLVSAYTAYHRAIGKWEDRRYSEIAGGGHAR